MYQFAITRSVLPFTVLHCNLSCLSNTTPSRQTLRWTDLRFRESLSAWSCSLHMFCSQSAMVCRSLASRRSVTRGLPGSRGPRGLQGPGPAVGNRSRHSGEGLLAASSPLEPPRCSKYLWKQRSSRVTAIK